MRQYAFAILFAVLAMIAGPTRAAICDPFVQPLDEFELEQVAASVRSNFPATYTFMLGDIRLRASDEPGYQTYFEGTPQGGVITVPSYMPKYICTILAIGAVLESGKTLNSVQIERLNALQNPCPNNQASDACMLPVLELLYDVMQPQMAEVTPAFAVTVPLVTREALKASLAHEYGHAIIDYGYADFRRDAITDHELEADLLALQPLAAQQSLPVADSLMFAALLMVERISKRSQTHTGVHELTACRIFRLQSIRAAVSPYLDSLAQWKPGNAPPPIVKANNFEIKLDEMKGCSTVLPSEIVAFRSDLEAVHAILTQMPNEPPSDSTLVPLEAFQPATTLGLTTYTIARYRAANAVEPPAVERKAMTEGQLMIAKTAARIRALDRVNAYDLTAASMRDYKYSVELLSFILLPAGTKVREAANMLHASITRADYGVTPSVNSLASRVVAEVLAGKCEAAIGSAWLARQIHNEGAGKFSGHGDLKVEPLPPVLAAFAEHQDKVDRGEATFDPAICEPHRQPIVANLKSNLGWVD